jgi:hypothetical protein
MASMALMAGSVSTGGIAALAARIVRGSKTESTNDSKVKERRNDDGNKNGNNDDEQN